MLKVSIITVLLNNQQVIADAITSVINQTYPNIEYIIIDGGSTDNSLAIVNAHKSKIAQIVSEPDSGVYFAMNKGLSLVTGEIVGFLNADDFYTSNDVIQSVVDFLTNTSFQSVYADLDYVSQANPAKIIRKWRSGKYYQKRFLYGWMPPHPTFFAYTSIYNQFGVFNTSLKLSSDYELMFRFLYVHQISCGYVNKVWVKMRVGGISNRNFKNRFLQNIENRNAWLINGITPKWYTLLLKPLSKIVQYFA